MRRAALLASLPLVAFACGPRSSGRAPPGSARPVEGIAITVYSPPGAPGFALVDDRRWIDVAHGEVTLDRIGLVPAGPASEVLASLAIVPLDDQPLSLGPCTRVPARRPSPPAVTCRVEGAAGRHFVRVVHATPAIAFRTRHHVVVEGDRATVVSRYAVTVPAWHVRVRIHLVDGVPGRVEPVRALGLSTLAIDGGTVEVASSVRKVSARVRRVFEGAIRDHDTSPTELAWGRESRHEVRTVLELDRARLAPGSLEVHAGLPGEQARDVHVEARDVEQLGDTVRVPLWIARQLHGQRESRATRMRRPDRGISQHVEYSVASSAAVDREVWIEERLRPGMRREVTVTPSTPPPEISNDLLRLHVVVPANETVRATLTVRYTDAAPDS